MLASTDYLELPEEFSGWPVVTYPIQLTKPFRYESWLGLRLDLANPRFFLHEGSS